MTSPLIRATDVSRHLGAFQIGPISLDLEPGLVYALVGPNGSGKTTLFRLLMGLIRPETGSIERFGASVAVDDPAQTRRIAYVPEALAGHEAWKMHEINELYRRMYPNFNVRALSRHQQGVDLHQQFSELSKGMQRRAMLGVALATQSDVLLFDEPTDGIDPFARRDVLASFAHYMEGEERTMLIATHNLEDVRRIADVVIVLEHGEHIGTWEKDELLEGWQRLWLASEPAQPLQGEVERTNEVGAGVQVVTNDLSASRAEIEQLGIDIISTQPVDMVETLQLVIQKQRGRASPGQLLKN